MMLINMIVSKRILIIALLLMSVYSCNDMNRNRSNGSSSAEFAESLQDCTFNVSYDSMEEAETKLLEVLESRYGHPDVATVSSRYRFYDELTDFVIKEPRTIEYEFEKLQSEGYANVVTSEDGNLRLYYWNNESGGTWIAWSNICQYRSGDKVCSFEGSIMDVKYEEEGESDELGNNCAILGIKTVYDESASPIYLVYAYVRESGNWGYRSIEAIKIEGDKLVAVPIFQGGIDMCDAGDQMEKCCRGVEHTIADWYFRANNGEGWNWLFRFDDKAKILYVPQADPEITDRYSLYRYDGISLSYVGTDGGFWLHPTIRSFERLERLFDTREYRIRIDRMFDGSYRYVSWKNSRSMADIPDAIIYDGVYDETTTEYRFKYNDYEYRVNIDAGIIVKHSGEIVLSQKIHERK